MSPRSIRLLPPLIAAVVFAAGLAGCGSTVREPKGGGDIFSGASSSSVSTTTTTAASTTTTSASISGLHTLATWSEGGAGTAVSETYRLGTIGYGTDADAAASEAVQSCPQYDNANPATNAYAEGQVTFRYTRGTLPLQLTLSLDHILEGVDVFNDDDQDGTIGDMSIQQSDGSWACGGMDDENEIDYTLQPGAVVTQTFWLILPQALTNAATTLSQIALNNLVLYPTIRLGDDASDPFTGSGPAFYKCPFGSVILPFASGSSVNTWDGTCTTTG